MATTWDTPNRAPSNRVREMKLRQQQAAGEAWNERGKQSLLDGFGQRERTGVGMRGPASAPSHLPPLPHQSSSPPPPQQQYPQQHQYLHPGGPDPVPVSGRGSDRRGVSTMESREIEAALREMRDGRQQIMAEASYTTNPFAQGRQPAASGGGATQQAPAHMSPSSLPRHHHNHQLSVVGGGHSGSNVSTALHQRQQHAADDYGGVDAAAPAPSSVLMQPMFREECYCCGERLRGRGDVAVYERARVLDHLLEPLGLGGKQSQLASPTPDLSAARQKRGGGGNLNAQKERRLDAKPRWQ